MWNEDPLSRYQTQPTIDETMHAMMVISNSNYEASASPFDPFKDPFLDFFCGQFIA